MSVFTLVLILFDARDRIMCLFGHKLDGQITSDDLEQSDQE